jgi:SAM-dependent methyltransferase
LPLMARVLGWNPDKRNMTMTQSITDTSYVFGHSDEEIQRLPQQARLGNPCTRRFLEQAGISAGMKVLDVGSGPGEVAMLLAERVGPGGAVVGVEIDPDTLDIARARVAGYENISFVAGDINRVDLDDDFDAIVGRLILIHLREPAATLRSLVCHLRPGGLVAFQDVDFTPPGVSMPPSRLCEQLDTWIKEAFRCARLEMQMGLKLYHLFLEAGLPAPCMSSEAAFVIGTRESNQAELELVSAWAVNVVHLLLPLILKSGIATAEEVAIDTLAERLRAEWATQHMVWRFGGDLVSAWTRKG